MTLFRQVMVFVALLTSSLLAGRASADEPSKKMCIEAHSKAQDAKEDGDLSLARKLFMTCAQPQCPGLVQSDCARFADELERQLPTLSFAARDGRGQDLPDTAVYVDDQLVATALGDGRPHEVDPGTHVVRFVHAGRDQSVTIVVGSGEKARPVVATFESSDSAEGETLATTSEEPAKPPRSKGARVLMIAGAAVVVAGGTLAILGLSRVPKNCELSTHECAAAPGDKSFGEAKDAVRLNNVGWGLAGVGVAALAGGITWYIRSGKQESEEEASQGVSPFVTAGGGGLVLKGRL